MTVVDASAVLEMLKQTDAGFRLEVLLADHELHAPHLIDLEVVNILRRWVIHGEMGVTEANQALEQFLLMPLQRHAHADLLPEVWKLRHNLTAYDASYLALARLLGAELVTMDEGLRKVAARGRPH